MNPNSCKTCGAQISSPKLTGELCAKHYFESKNQSNQTNDAVADRLISPPIETNQITTILEPNQYEQPNNNPNAEADSNIEIGTIKESEESKVIEQYDIKKEHHPSVDKNQSVDDSKKYCQSCIERGYGLKLATRELRKGEFICDDCFEPLLDNVLGYGVARAEIERIIPQTDSSKPLLGQFYDLLQIPEQLRFTKSEQVLTSRNDIFNYHAQALVNKSKEEVLNWIEQLQVMLFQIKLSLEPNADYINRVKAEERAKANLEGISKSKKEITKGPSKTKLSQDEKMAKVLGMSLERYQEMAKAAKTKEFDKIVDGK